MKNIQVNKEHYDFLSYEYMTRFASYFFQLKTIHEIMPNKILEIGKGSGLFSRELKNNNFDLVILDFDSNLNPDIVGDIRELPFPKESFDCICAFQVLEHLPFEDFSISIKELKRVSKQYIFISLPNSGRYFKYDLVIPKIGRLRKMISLSKFKKDIHVFDGEHYWEINKVNYDESIIKEILICKDWELLLEERLFENPYHQFYLLGKRK